MFFELRQYRCRPGQREKWVKYMEEVIIPYQVSKGMVVLGSFVGEQEDDLYVWIRRFDSEEQREELYAACYDAGVCVLETTQVGFSEDTGRPRHAAGLDCIRPTVSRRAIAVLPGAGEVTMVTVWDGCGREVLHRDCADWAGPVWLDVSRLAAGPYFVEVVSEGRRNVGKFVRQ